MNWLAPEIEVTLAGQTRRANVRRMEIVAGRTQPVSTAYLELSNVHREWDAVASIPQSPASSLVLRWGYRGQDLHPLFDGTVLRAQARETLKVWGLCRARALADTRVTRTYHEESADAVMNHLVAGLGFPSMDIAPCDLVIDKLPLQDNTVLEAICFLNRRLELDRAFYTDPEGGFHCTERDTAQAPAFTFTHGQDILGIQSLPGNRHLLTVMGIPVWHSQVVTIVDRDGSETRHFIEQVRHRGGSGGSGLRTHLWLKEVSDA